MMTNDYAEPAAALTSGRMPLLGFGTWQISNRDASQATAYALQAGYRHIDTATMYQNESGIGKALASVALPRESVFVTTKLPPAHAGRERRTLGESLTKLGLDYVDLWLVHWPPNGQAAPRVWQQFIRAQQEGLTKAIGVSNYSLRQIDELIHLAAERGPAIYIEPTHDLGSRHVDDACSLDGVFANRIATQSADGRHRRLVLRRDFATLNRSLVAASRQRK